MYAGCAVMTVKDQVRDICSDVTNLPEEMESIISSRGGLDALKECVPEKADLVLEARFFHSLSDPIRLQILHALMTMDLCPCILKEITELSDSKLSYHLNILERAGLIVSSPRKKWRIYSLTGKGRSLIARGMPVDRGTSSP
ncbi:MAG: metalloregulator ArsR/SmtB family transcription factor, partial [Candidatus Methanomethylophilaceae archaeon]